MAAVWFFRYINSIRSIETHFKDSRPDDWEKLGKPNIFSGKYSEKNVKFREFIDSENEGEEQDAKLIILVERSRQMARTMTIITWSAFGMYVFTIPAVRFLLNRIAGT